MDVMNVVVRETGPPYKSDFYNFRKSIKIRMSIPREIAQHDRSN